jgi:hypothetical protein
MVGCSQSFLNPFDKMLHVHIDLRHCIESQKVHINPSSSCIVIPFFFIYFLFFNILAFEF